MTTLNEEAEALTHHPRLPLAGIRVVEVTQLIAGPLCGRLLLGLGADVLKIEPPGGEPGRRLPPLLGDTSALHRFANAGKEVVEWDLSTAAGQAQLRAALGDADVLVENLQPKALRRSGIPDEPAGPRNRPGIRCSIRGSAASPDQRAVDSTVQALTGLMWILGSEHQPRREALPVIDVLAGALAALDVSAGVAAGRHRTGWNSVVSLTSAATLLQGPLLLAAALGVSVQPLNGMSPFVAPSDPFTVDDGHVAISILDDTRWRRVCDRLGITADERDQYLTLQERFEHRSAVHELLQHAMTGRRASDVVTMLTEEGVPCARVSNYDEVLDNSEVAGWLASSTAPMSGEQK